jgi:hypothetical protein
MRLTMGKAGQFFKVGHALSPKAKNFGFSIGLKSASVALDNTL